MTRRSMGIGILIWLALLLAVAGCGRKTPVIPPYAVVPLPIDDLRFEADDTGITLRWTCPTRAEDGTRLEEVRTFAILKSEVPFASFCADCPLQFPHVITISGEDVKPGSELTWRDTDLQNRHHYTYKVISQRGWKITSRDSNLVSFPWDSPLVAPVGLHVEVADQRLTVSWQPVTARLDGSVADMPVLYQLYRSEDGTTFTRVGDPQVALSRQDTELTNNRRYYYQVRALAAFDDSLMPGAASEVIAATPRDLTPPAPPHKFTAAVGAKGVTILWESIAGEDVAGYRIYRRTAGEKEYVLVGETGAFSFSFTDAQAPIGEETLYYAVTAIDSATPPNESIYSREIEVRRRLRPGL
ncbi:MAG: fibronectin type III domain-containing protein [Thermodesulfobacteriota bacterium]